MALICAANRRASVSLLRFPFHSHVKVFLCEIFASLSLEIPIQLFSFPFLFSSYSCFFVLMMSVLSLAAVISLSLLFLI